MARQVQETPSWIFKQCFFLFPSVWIAVTSASCMTSKGGNSEILFYFPARRTFLRNEEEGASLTSAGRPNMARSKIRAKNRRMNSPGDRGGGGRAGTAITTDAERSPAATMMMMRCTGAITTSRRYSSSSSSWPCFQRRRRKQLEEWGWRMESSFISRSNRRTDGLLLTRAKRWPTSQWKRSIFSSSTCACLSPGSLCRLN